MHQLMNMGRYDFWWFTDGDALKLIRIKIRKNSRTFPAYSDLVLFPKTLLATSCWVAGRKTPAPRWRRQYFSKSLSHPALPVPKIFFTYSFHRSTSPAFCFKNGIRDASSTADSGLLMVLWWSISLLVVPKWSTSDLSVSYLIGGLGFEIFIRCDSISYVPLSVSEWVSGSVIDSFRFRR